MSAIGGDLEYELRRIHPIDSNTLFAAAWSDHDTGYCGNYPIFAVSFHLSTEQRKEFKAELYASYDKKWGKQVPPSYHAIHKAFSVIASPELYQFTTETTQLNKRGVVVLISNLKYLPRLGLIEPNTDLDTLIIKHGSEFKEELMTQNRVLAEIKDDTSLWYQDLTNPSYDTGWITIK